MQVANQIHQATTKQGFPAGEPNLLDPLLNEQADHARVVRNRQFGGLHTIFAGATVDAAIVTAVGDGDAKIGDGAAEAVTQARRNILRLCRAEAVHGVQSRAGCKRRQYLVLYGCVSGRTSIGCGDLLFGAQVIRRGRSTEETPWHLGDIRRRFECFDDQSASAAMSFTA